MDYQEADDAIMAKYIASSQQDAIKEKAKGPSLLTLPYDPDRPRIDIEVTGASTVTYEFQAIPNEQVKRIVVYILPKVVELYMSKSRDYGGNVMELMKLGPKACIPDMLRKFGKLKRSIWDGEQMVGEQPEEILMDLIGHILITLDGMGKIESKASVLGHIGEAEIDEESEFIRFESDDKKFIAMIRKDYI